MIKGDETIVSKGAKFTVYVSGDASFDPAQVRQEMALLETKNAALLAAATAGKTEVPIYRHIPDIGPGKPTIYLDEKPLARIQQGRYVTLLLDPVARNFRIDRFEVRQEFKAGEEYYLLEEVHRSFWGEPTATHGAAHLTLVPGEQGEDEMYPLLPAHATDVKDAGKLVRSEARP